MIKRTSSFSDIGKETSLRFDVNFINYQKTHEAVSDFSSFNDLFSIADQISPKGIDGDFQYCQIGDVDDLGITHPVVLNFDNAANDKDNSAYYKKIAAGDIFKPVVGDILVSKVRPYLKKIVFIDKHNSNVYFTTAFICLRPKANGLSLFYALRSAFMNDINSVSRQGKGYPTITPYDLCCIKLSKKIASYVFSGKIVKEIFELHEKLYNVLSGVVPENVIIDETFDNEFGFDNLAFEEKNKTKIFGSNFCGFGSNDDLRFSTKYHRPSVEYSRKELWTKSHDFLGNFLDPNTFSLGSSITPDDYEEGTDFFYLSMADISSWHVNQENMKSVSRNYYDNNQAKTVQQDDIVMTRSGEGGIGKVALVDCDEKTVFSDFVIRMRPVNANPQFLYYYFRTYHFQNLVVGDKKGLGNNTNIFPTNLFAFPMLDVSLPKQNQISSTISDSLAKQKTYFDKVKELVNKIERLATCQIGK